MDLKQLFERFDLVVEHNKRAESKKVKPSKIVNPEVLSPEAFTYYRKECNGGVKQEVSVRLSKNNTFIYVSHSRF